MKNLFKKPKGQVIERRRPGAEAGPRVFSYYARGSNTNPQNTGRYEQQSNMPQSEPRARYRRLIYLPSYIALFVVCGAVLYSLSLKAEPKVIILNQAGTVARPTQVYQTGISSLWKRSILNLTKLTVHSSSIRSEALQQFSELSEIQIELPLLGRRPTVVVTPGKPALQLISGNGAFYVNSTGKVMAKVSDVNQNHLENLPLVRDESGIPAEPGTDILSESETTFLHKVSLQLVQEGLVLESITLPASAANEADIRLQGKGYYIKFSTLSDPRQAVGTYQAVKARFSADNIQPQEYVDVRVEEKVFYK